MEIIVNKILEKQQQLIAKARLKEKKYEHITFSPTKEITIALEEVKRQQFFIEKYIRKRADTSHKGQRDKNKKNPTAGLK